MECKQCCVYDDIVYKQTFGQKKVMNGVVDTAF